MEGLEGRLERDVRRVARERFRDWGLGAWSQTIGWEPGRGMDDVAEALVCVIFKDRRFKLGGKFFSWKK